MEYYFVIIIILISIFLYKYIKQPKIEVISRDDTSEIVKKIHALVKVTTDKAVEKAPIYEKPYRKFRFLLNSSQRGDGQDVNDYFLSLYEPVYSIAKVELVRANFPTSLKLITYNNKTIFLRENSDTVNYPVILTPGYYNAEELASHIQTVFNDVSTHTYTVTYEPSTGILTISNPTMDFRVIISDYLHAILGIAQDSSSVLTGGLNVITGTLPVNTSFPQNIILKLSTESHDLNSLNLTSSEGQQCFAFMNIPSGTGMGGIIPSSANVSGSAILVEGAGGTSGFGTYVITKDQTNAYYKSYEGTLPRINRFHVQLKQILPSGSIVDADFSNIDHTIELEVTARVDKSSLKKLD